MRQEYNISLSEYAGEVCLILYHSPCSLHCNWCFNKNNLKNSLLQFDESKKIIIENRDYITSVCLSGGEPLLSRDFNNICEYIKDENLKLKINTSGVIQPSFDTFKIDYVNLSLKGTYSDYCRYGYQKSEEDLINNISILSNQDFFKEVEWSVVYHPLIIDLNNTLRFISSFNERPNHFTLNQLQVGDCYDKFINDFTQPTRSQLKNKIKIFEEIPKNHLIIETKEFGREIII